MSMLEVKDLRVAYGKIEAVKGISFDVEEGQVVSLIGTPRIRRKERKATTQHVDSLKRIYHPVPPFRRIP